MVSCIACGTSHVIGSRRGITFHIFPKNKIRRKFWLKFVNLTEEKLTKGAVLCSQHFKEEDIDRISKSNVRLKKYAVPTVVVVRPKYARSLREQKSFKVDKMFEPRIIKESDNEGVSVLLQRIRNSELSNKVIENTPNDNDDKSQLPKTPKIRKSKSSIKKKEKTVAELYETIQLKSHQIKKLQKNYWFQKQTIQQLRRKLKELEKENSTIENLDTKEVSEDKSEHEETQVTTSLCRLCASYSKNIIQIFSEEANKNDLLNKIHTYLPIRVTEEDMLPLNVCSHCLTKLEACNDFVKMCLEADTKLRFILGLPEDNEDFDDTLEGGTGMNVNYSESEECEITEVEEIYPESLVEECADLPATLPPCKESAETAKDTNMHIEQHSQLKSPKIVEQPSLISQSEDNENKGKMAAQNRSVKNNPTIIEIVSESDNEKNKVNEGEKQVVHLTSKKSTGKMKSSVVNDKIQETPSESSSPQYNCVYCGLTFKQHDKLINHQLSAHSDKFSTCTICQPNLLFYTSKSIYNTHMSECHAKKELNDAPVFVETYKTISSDNVENTSPTHVTSVNTVLEIVSSENDSANGDEDDDDSGTDDDEDDDIDDDDLSDSSANDLSDSSAINEDGNKISNVTTKTKSEAGNNSGNKSRSCYVCDKKFFSKTLLAEHIRRCHKERNPTVCEFCCKQFSNSINLLRHLDVHKIGSYACGDCTLKFASLSDLKKHSKCHEKYLCDICGKDFDCARLYYAHEKTVHHKNEEKRFLCEICGKAYSKRYYLEEHLKEHTEESHFKCPECPKAFRKSNLLKQHSIVHIENPEFQCTLCDKRFKLQKHLAMHAEVHKRTTVTEKKKCKRVIDNQVGPKQCNICNKTYTNKMTFYAHMRQHNATKAYTCVYCDKPFLYKMQFETHMRMHTGEKPFRCSYCSDRFTSKATQILHERRHTGEKPFKCNICDKAFRIKSLLLQHIIVHSNNRKFACPQCDKRFKRADALVAHTRSHTGERPFECEICGQKFKYQGDRNKHEKAHVFKTLHNEVFRPADSKHKKVRVQKFLCSLCPMEFISRTLLEAHVSSNHQQEIVTLNNWEKLKFTESQVTDSQVTLYGETVVVDSGELIIPELEVTLEDTQ